MGTTLALAGDVMTGRGIDRILPHPGDPALHEPYVRSAETYVDLAEAVHGPIPRPVDPAYVWGDALGVLASADHRVVNLETAVTTSDSAEPKGINYRMHPANVAVLTTAGIDVCVLANNHVLDWGPAGLLDTLDVLRGAGIGTAGAGREEAEALAPAVRPGTRRLLVFAFAAPSSGVPTAWVAQRRRPGIAVLADVSDRSAAEAAARISSASSSDDVVVVSIHWGPNWGYGIPTVHRDFARRLVHEAPVSVVFGHSSHHPMGVEVVAGVPVLYGSGDFLNDYEGISGHEEYRPDLTLLHLVTVGATVDVEMVPFRIRRFRLERAAWADTTWLAGTLDRECRRLGAGVGISAGGTLVLR